MEIRDFTENYKETQQQEENRSLKCESASIQKKL